MLEVRLQVICITHGAIELLIRFRVHVADNSLEPDVTRCVFLRMNFDDPVPVLDLLGVAIVAGLFVELSESDQKENHLNTRQRKRRTSRYSWNLCSVRS